MFSKEWKLVALSMLAVGFLTACPGKKNRNAEATNKFKGMWVNAEAARNLNGQALDPRQMEPLCFAINSRIDELGIEETFMREILLDAWVIHGNGDVYRYSAFQNSVSHGYRNPKYLSGKIAGTSFNRDTQTGSASFTSYEHSPFARGVGILTLDNNQLFVAGSAAMGYGGPSHVTYVRATNEQLIAMTNLVTACQTRLDFGRRRVRHHAPAPQCVGPQCSAPQVGPQQFPPPANFEQGPPLGPK